MKSREFNSLMPKVNHAWASDVLNVSLNSGLGPDLFDEGKFVELKFSLINPKPYNCEKLRKYPKAWIVD
ncbi:hypothetical protein J4456_03755 [Candidatus Pacearchaeota archaeon]|nr:hypothetical protein [Candidatus Pacearchaeota archaeon]